MNFFSFQLKYLFFLLVIFLSFFFNYNADKNDKNVSIKKVRKVDISILREDLINQLVKILKLIEITLNKLLKDLAKKNFVDKSEEVMNIFHWVNECIAKFNDDPTIYGRSEIELYLNQAQKYTLFLNSL